MVVSVRLNPGDGKKDRAGPDEGTRFAESFSLGSALYIAAEHLESGLKSDPKLVERLWEHIAEPTGPTGAIVVFALFASPDEPFLIAEFIQGETIAELAQRCDRPSCEQNIPMFRRIFDAFERMKNDAAASDSSTESLAGVRTGNLELIELGIAQIRPNAMGGTGIPKLHGSVVVTPARVVGARAISETQE